MRFLIILVFCSSAFATDVADNASERIPPENIQGKTNDSGKSVGIYDFIKWLLGKDK